MYGRVYIFRSSVGGASANSTPCHRWGLLGIEILRTRNRESRIFLSLGRIAVAGYGRAHPSEFALKWRYMDCALHPTMHF